MKSIIKEIFIIVFLFIIIGLIFSVIFYDYIPNNKIVPSTVEAYKTSDSVKKEIEEKIVDFQKQNITLEITDSTLDIRKQDHTYDSGKANPFAVVTTEANEEVDKNIINKDENSNSKDHFFNNQSGLK